MTALPASVLGIGVVTPLGRDLPTIQKNLEKPAPASAILRVNDDFLSDPAIVGRMRRADRFARMAAVAASDCWNDARPACQGVAKQRIGLIVSSGFGPHCRGFRFLDGILDCGDGDALPTDFSHSVHGAAAAYITEILELRGPSLTTTDFEIGFEQAVGLAQCWLDERVCDRVLVGAVEEIGEVLIHCASRLLGKEGFVPGEGAIFLMVGPPDADGFVQLEATPLPRELDLLMLDVPALPSTAGQKPAAVARHTTTFSPYFGHTASSSAFQLLGGMLAIRAGQPLGQLIPPALARSPGAPGEAWGEGLSPESQPHPIPLPEYRERGNKGIHRSAETASSIAVDKAATFKPSCDPRMASLLLTKTSLKDSSAHGR